MSFRPPKGAALGWWFKFDDDVRAARAALGYELPEVTDADRAWAEEHSPPEPETIDDDEAF